MSTLWPRIEPLLARVQKPARYIGCEDGAITPRHDKLSGAAVAWLFAYPDTYEIGLPNQGLQILYQILNERDDAVAERTYAPWPDLDAELRAAGVPLFSVDTHRAAADFDILAFNLSSELVFTNVLNMIDLAGTPVRQADRSDLDPIVIVGGHAAFNPEPLADFIDAAVLGEGEEVVAEINQVVLEWKQAGRRDRTAFLRCLSRVPGVYVPAMYEVTYLAAAPGHVVGAIEAITPRHVDVPATVDKRTVADLADWPYPRNPLVPLTEVVHDRLSVEVFRGCTRGCRFCQAGMITRPVRERPAEQVRTMIGDGLRRTGYDEVTLTSLSTADFSDIEPVIRGVLADNADRPGACDNLTINLPSLRVDAFTVGLAGEVSNRTNSGRRSGLTFAPEGGSWRLRKVINKLITEDDLYGAVESAFSQGWTRMKLYFLTGLPTETDDDTLGIAELARNCVAIGRRYTNRASVTISLGGFVPKPHTPFQWFGQVEQAELSRRVFLLRDALKQSKESRGVQLKWHDPAATTVEGIASRGDRRIGAVIERVWRAGGTFQEWGEHFDLALWEQSLDAVFGDAAGALDWFVYRHRPEDEVLPWEHLTAGLHKDFLWNDWQDALVESGVEDCRWTPCYDCGVCTGYGIEHVVASPLPPAGGSQGTGQDLSRGGDLPRSVTVTLLARKPDGVPA
jgi:radical SAM family uncharacterized protein